MNDIWLEMSYNRIDRNYVVKENYHISESMDLITLRYGLLEDLYRCTTLSVEQVYEEKEM